MLLRIELQITAMILTNQRLGESKSGGEVEHKEGEGCRVEHGHQLYEQKGQKTQICMSIGKRLIGASFFWSPFGFLWAV